MAKHYIILLVCYLCIFFYGCTTEVNIPAHVNLTKPLTVIESKKNVIDGTTSNDKRTIEVNSEVYQKFLSWSKDNILGWEAAPASYLTDIVVNQENFSMRFNINSEFVIVSFKDENGNARQFTKSIDESELDFLTE